MRSTHLRIFVLRELLVPSLQLYRDLVSLRLIPMLDRCLDYPARIVLEHDLLDLPSNDIHESFDMLLAFLFGDFFLAGECPGALC